MNLLLALFAAAASLALSTFAQDVSYANETLGHVIVGTELLKRACSGTCSYCYGSGYTSCGANVCYNPSAGQTCCTAYQYACDYGYYCAPGGLQNQCCSSSITSAQCTSTINNYGSSSGLSSVAKIGIGIGIVVVALLIAVGVGVCLCIRRRRRSPVTLQPAGPGGWQMSGLSSTQGVPPMQNNNGWGSSPGPQNAGTPQGGWATPAMQSNGWVQPPAPHNAGSPQPGWASPHMQNNIGFIPPPSPQNAGSPQPGWASPHMQNNNGLVPPPAPQNAGSPQSGWVSPLSPGNQGGWASPQTQGLGNQGGWQPSPGMKVSEPYNGGPPVAASHPPGQNNGEFGAAAGPAMELADTHPTHHSQPAPPYSENPGPAHVYPQMSAEERRTAVEV